MFKKIITILVFFCSFSSHYANNAQEDSPQAPSLKQSHFVQNWKKYATGAAALGALYYMKDFDAGKKVVAFFYTDKIEFKKMCNNALQTALSEQYYDALFTAQECSTRIIDPTRTLGQMRNMLNKIMFESNIGWKTQYAHALGRLITRRTPAVMQAASVMLYDTKLKLFELQNYAITICTTFGSYKLQSKFRSWFTYYTVTQPLQRDLQQLKQVLKELTIGKNIGQNKERLYCYHSQILPKYLLKLPIDKQIDFKDDVQNLSSNNTTYTEKLYTVRLMLCDSTTT